MFNTYVDIPKFVRLLIRQNGLPKGVWSVVTWPAGY